MSDDKEINKHEASSFSPKSGYRYEVIDGETRILAPNSNASVYNFDREKTVRRLADIHQVNESEVEKYYGRLSDDELFAELESNMVGYTMGVTARDVSQSNEAIPNISETIKNSRSNILIIANGLSEVATLNPDVPVTVMDRVSYPQMCSDFQEMETSDPDLFEKFKSQARVAEKITDGGNVKAVRHIIGLGVSNLPQNERNKYQTVVSYYGPIPDKSKISEFLALAKEGGEIYVDWQPDIVEKSIYDAGIQAGSTIVEGIRNGEGRVVASKITLIHH